MRSGAGASGMGDIVTQHARDRPTGYCPEGRGRPPSIDTERRRLLRSFSMSCAVLSPLSSLQERWTSPGLFTVIALSACTAPLLGVGNVTLTGDRLLGAAAVIAVAVMAITRSLHWTAIHSAVAAFAAIQMITSLAAVSTWPAGPRFATVYVFGFASFALAAELAARARDPWAGARVWIAVGAILGIAGAG